jgi:phosphatidylinositol-3-phosphatase
VIDVRGVFSILGFVALAAGSPSALAAPNADARVPRYQHIIVIVEENKDYAQVVDPASAPNIAGLAATYGNATNFYAEAHPSEANYVALLGGDTFGIHDDDGYFCHAGLVDPACAGSAEPGYADHTVRAPNLSDQLGEAGLTWKGYYENLPAPGSGVVVASDPAFDNGTRKTALYAAKHSGFMNFESVQRDPARANHIVGFEALGADLASNRLPTFALIVPNQCNEMHGLHGPNVPADCDGANPAALIARGDRVAGDLVRRIEATGAWRSNQNVAIVITFDESSGKSRAGCCGVTPDAASNFGGGHIPTIVITNHGPRGLADPTPYNHYSLLRTMEDAFGIHDHLGHAGDAAAGMVAMAPLFAVK